MKPGDSVKLRYDSKGYNRSCYGVVGSVERSHEHSRDAWIVNFDDKVIGVYEKDLEKINWDLEELAHDISKGKISNLKEILTNNPELKKRIYR